MKSRSDINLNVADILIQLRAERGWSQEQLAIAAGVSRTTISQIEQGRSVPRAATARKLATTFEIPLSALLHGPRVDQPPATPRPRTAPTDAWNQATNPRIAEIVAEFPERFADWTDTDWRELYGTFGVGGPLTDTGVLHVANGINRRNRLRTQVDVILETHLGDPLAAVIEAFYRMISVADQTAPPSRTDSTEHLANLENLGPDFRDSGN